MGSTDMLNLIILIGLNTYNEDIDWPWKSVYVKITSWWKYMVGNATVHVITVLT